jgi:D-galactarolactone cycloisomerase
MMTARSEIIEIAAPLVRPFHWATGTAVMRRTTLVHCLDESGFEGWGETLRGDVAGAVEIARWDASARQAGLSLAALLSSRAAADVEVYASGLYYDDGDLSIDAARFLEEGFTRVKMKIGRLGIADDLRRVRRVRDAIGDAELMVDANGAYREGDALAIAPALRDHGVGWLEEPFPLHARDAYRALRDRRIIDIAAGESLNAAELRELIDVVDVIQPNVATCGGVTATLEILRLAVERGVRPAIHAWGTPIMTAVSLHVAAACAELGVRPLVEIDRTPNPLRAIAPDFAVRNGAIALPFSPGLGVDVAHSTVAAFRVRSAA